MAFETPVAFFIFNRPDLTRRVFAAIRDARPTRLLVVADGARYEAEEALCQQARVIVDGVDWPCEVETNFSATNLGCKRRVSSGMDWVFSRVEEAIILEDDCLPHPSFFGYCAELLEKYRDDERIMMISGDNFQKQPTSSDSYYFSHYTHIWGWATWRRAWQHAVFELSLWQKFRDEGLLPFSTTENQYWKGIFGRTHAGLIDTWDYQWQFAVLTQNGLVILPNRNLVSNLGFGPAATHTTSPSPRSEMPTFDIGSLQHPDIVAPHAHADALTFSTVFHAEDSMKLWHRIRRRAKRILLNKTRGGA